ncbi:MAG TPA: DNA/RNA endonuclease [Lentisphaeria bacterium]|nr:MAG: hypothetical protein A2X48_16680 [Lentisphaerae bacterium GWF2_49_21]HBC89440.1 DNA/RNA endonuclease [Lentisphaeria bacterium]
MIRIISVLLFIFSISGWAQIELPKYEANDQIVRHSAYTLKYNEKYEEADWVAYKLTKSMLITNTPAKRKNDFKPDPLVLTKSADTHDYASSGYDRGHLCPSADFKADQKLMDETFFMSNMTPMEHDFNSGNWEDLEDHERRWAIDNGEIYIVTGPILKDEPQEYIGKKNRVAVAKRFFKVILDYREPELKMIAFVVPHKGGLDDISIYAMTVREAEKITGFDFFSTLPKDIQDKLETELDFQKWGLHTPSTRYNQKAETVSNTPEARPLSPRPQGASNVNEDQIVLYVLAGLGIVLVVLGIVIFIGLRMNKRK